MLHFENFALQEQLEDNLMVSISPVWYNCSYTMAAKPIKSLELHYTMIQFLIIHIICLAITKYDFEAAVLYPNQSDLYCTLEFTIHSFFVVSFNLNHIFNHSMANLIRNNNKWFGRKSKDVYLLSIPQD